MLLTRNCNIGHATQTMKDAAIELKDVAVKTGAETFEKCCSETDSLVRANPYSIALLALSLGYLAGTMSTMLVSTLGSRRK